MLENIAKELRRDIILAAYRGKTGHLASAFSSVEIMTVLYFADILQYDLSDSNWEERDKLIVSKGHASLVLYRVLKRLGYITQEQLNTYCQPGSSLGGEPMYGEIPGVEASTGSLGHGLSFAVGVAMASAMDKKKNRIYVLLGDGECQEGSIWEAALSAAQNKLGNLTVILDRNQLQAMGNKWESFGWSVKEVDGHNISELQEVLKKDKMMDLEQPRLIIAHTIKGKGVSFMENVPIWHYRMPNDEEMEIVKRELNISEKELRS